jgi:CDP-glucose 4,6-dehydratase
VKNILITGANGLMASHLCNRLVNSEEDYRVVGIVKDRNFRSRRDVLDRISVAYGDIRDIDFVRYTMSRYEVDTVFHLAAVTILKQSVKDPFSCYDVNIMGTVCLLQAATEVGVKKFVSKSSDKAYGTYHDLPYVETMNVQPSADPYSTSKACMDMISQEYAWRGALDVSIVRAGNIYGHDLNASRLIPRSMMRCIDGLAPVIYSGVGEYKREFLWAEDVVDAYLTVAERGASGESYNVGGSGFMTVFETVEKICEVAGFQGKPEVIEKGGFKEIKEQYLDASKLQRLGWECKYPIGEGLKEAYKWYKQYKTVPEFKKQLFYVT